MLNKEKMIKWAEALESGQYEQCRGSWGRGDLPSESYGVEHAEGFCCLHVALTIEGYDRENSSKLRTLRNIYGLDSGTLDLFIKMNDQQYLSFPEIAAEIRKMVDAA